MHRLALAGIALAALTASSGTAAAQRRHPRKPSPPVTLAAHAERTATGWQVVVDATPARDVASLAVEVDGRATTFGASLARRPRHLVVPVKLDAVAGRDVVVSARLAGRSTAVVVRVGAPAPAPVEPAITVRVVNGIEIAEVRE